MENDNNIMEIFSILTKATEAKENLNTICFELTENLDILRDFLSDLVETIEADQTHLYSVRNLRQSLSVVQDNLLMIFNNLEVETAVPRDTTGTKVD